MKEVEKINEEGILTIWHKRMSSMSKSACINYDKEKDPPTKYIIDNMVEFKWWGNFDSLKDKDLCEEAKEWCKENCNGLVYGNHYSGSFKFELKEDAFAFRMRWT